jgi:hypothetical protein
MATIMTAGILSGKASKGQFAGVRRDVIIEKKIKLGLPFTVIDGGREKKIVMQSYSKKDKSFLDKKGDWEYSLSSLIKDEDFGGQPGKKQSSESVQLGGTVTEGLSEGFFCVYLALLIVGKLKKFNPSELTKKNGLFSLSDFSTWCAKNGISNILKYALYDNQFTKEAKHFYGYLTTKNGNKTMHEIFTAQVNAFSSAKNVHLRQGFFLMRQGQLKDTGANPYDVFAKMSKKIKDGFKLSSAPKDDKWNPSDVWMINNIAITKLKQCSALANKKASATAPYQVGVLNDLNTCIQDLWLSKNLYPISLKLPGNSVHVTLENNTSPGGLAKVIRYEKFELKNSNQDIQIFFSIDYVDNHSGKMIEKNAYQLRLKTKTKSGGHRFEIESVKGGGARYGTVGVGLQEYIVSNTAPGSITKLNAYRQKYPNLISEKILNVSNRNQWINVSDMTKKFKDDSKDFQTKITPYFEALFKLIGTGPIPTNKNAEFYLNKTHSAEIGYIMKSIGSNLVKSQVVTNIYDIANSQRFAVGVDMKKIEQYQKMTGNGKLEEIDPKNKTAYKILFESSFHYVIK